MYLPTNFSFSNSLLLVLLSCICCFSPLYSWAKAVPTPPTKKHAPTKPPSKRAFWSFKKPAYYQQQPLDFQQKRHPEQLDCEGPDMGSTVLILLLLVLIWAIPTGLLVFFGLLFSILWLWILGVVLFAVPVLLLAILFIGVSVS